MSSTVSKQTHITTRQLTMTALFCGANRRWCFHTGPITELSVYIANLIYYISGHGFR